MSDASGCGGIEDPSSQCRRPNRRWLVGSAGRFGQVDDGACPLEQRLQVGGGHIDTAGVDPRRNGRHLTAIDRQDPGDGRVCCRQGANLLTQQSGSADDNDIHTPRLAE